MALVSVVKHWNELTKDELYRIIQLRIDGFIVRNKVCYQDLEYYYDESQVYFMWYDTVLGIAPQLMVGTNSLCDRKVFVGDDGTEYRYPAFRRQAWERSYKGGCSTRDLILGREVAIKYWGSPNMMLEITYEGGKQPFLDFGCKEVGTNVDPAGRVNWVFVYEEKNFKNKIASEFRQVSSNS